jgi:hypothetical protein
MSSVDSPYLPQVDWRSERKVWALPCVVCSTGVKAVDSIEVYQTLLPKLAEAIHQIGLVGGKATLNVIKGFMASVCRVSCGLRSRDLSCSTLDLHALSLLYMSQAWFRLCDTVPCADSIRMPRIRRTFV